MDTWIFRHLRKFCKNIFVKFFVDLLSIMPANLIYASMLIYNAEQIFERQLLSKKKNEKKKKKNVYQK